MKTLRNKLVLITGAGHGLGLETARKFAEEGACVLISDRDPDRVSHAVQELARDGLQVVGYVMDVTDPADVRLARERILRERGKIAVLVNNAGIVSGGDFAEIPLEKHLTTIDVNANGPIIVTHTFLHDLLSHNEAALVNIASASALIALPKGASYAASKWATLGFTDSLREELKLSGRDSLTVTSICPSYISTGMFHGVTAPWLVPLLTPEWLAAKIVRCVRKKREQFLAPSLVSLLPLAKATWPRFLFRKLLSFLGVYQSMHNWQGHGGLPQTPPGAPEVVRAAG
ncbi:SDR family NAD(P)-dependent oxidoreductase [bacterium]|nr:SDR family NAD(P)-dependent oxidoreductase [bacterium]